MALKNKEEKNAYMRAYMLKRYYERRNKAIEVLGGKCVRCGTREKLEFDHIDRTTKILSIAKYSSASNEKFWNEINKCQLLCHPCHLKKSFEYGDIVGSLAVCGTHTMYRRGCRCENCRTANKAYHKSFNRIRKTCSTCRKRTTGFKIWMDNPLCLKCYASVG